MAIPPVAFKRKNHRLLLCETTRKDDLLVQLIELHQDKHIAVITSGDAGAITVPEHVTLLTDSTLPKKGTASFDVVISYDLPREPQHYLDRLAYCDDIALCLLGEADQPNLMAIEMMLGRAISQERPEGFAPALPAQPKFSPKRNRQSASPERSETAPKKAPFKKEGRLEQQRKPKESGVSRYIGTDENGKPMFSGKTGERNHRKDGKPHDEESLAAKKEWDEKRKKSGGKKPYDANKRPPFKGESDRRKPFDKTAERRESESGEKKPYDKKKPAYGERRPYDAKKPPYKGENDRRKPFDKTAERRESEGGEKKPYDNKKPAFRGEKKPYGAKAPFKGNKKPFGAKGPAKGPKEQSSEAAKPKRPPRRIKADAFKPTEPKE